MSSPTAFSQAAVAEAMCAHSGLAKLVSQLLMLPGFAYAHDVEGRRIGGPLVAPNPVLHKMNRPWFSRHFVAEK
ncbi:hypothetical protein [Aeromonas caviae]